jgi:hypothetical protein
MKLTQMDKSTKERIVLHFLELKQLAEDIDKLFVSIDCSLDLYSKIPWHHKLLFQRENAFASFLGTEGLGNSTNTLPGNNKT